MDTPRVKFDKPVESVSEAKLEHVVDMKDQNMRHFSVLGAPKSVTVRKGDVEKEFEIPTPGIWYVIFIPQTGDIVIGRAS